MRKELVMDTIIKSVTVMFAIFSATAAVPEYHRVEVQYGLGKSAIQDVMFDEDEQYSIVALTNVTGKVTPSVNLHDFATGYSAIKDVNHGRCFIKESTHPMLETKIELGKAVKNGGHYEVKEYFTCLSEEAVLKSELIRFGERIAAFCANYESTFAKTVHVERSKRSLVMMAEDSMGCFICGGNADCRDNNKPKPVLELQNFTRFSRYTLQILCYP